MDSREALKLTIEKFKLAQIDLAKKTRELERQGQGKRVHAEQLNRYLRGQQDIYLEGFESLIKALPDLPRGYFLRLLLVSYLPNKESRPEIPPILPKDPV